MIKYISQLEFSHDFVLFSVEFRFHRGGRAANDRLRVGLHRQLDGHLRPAQALGQGRLLRAPHGSRHLRRALPRLLIDHVGTAKPVRGVQAANILQRESAHIQILSRSYRGTIKCSVLMSHFVGRCMGGYI